MFYLFPLLLSKLPLVGACLLVTRLMTFSIPIVEEREHVLFALISIIVLLLVWSSIEGGIKL